MPANGAEITSQLTVVEATDYGLPLRYLVAYNVTTWLDGTSQSDLTTKETKFRAALLQPKQDFVLKTDAGARSSLAIISKDTTSGTRVVSIATPVAQGPEFVNRRTITFVVTAEYDVVNADRAVISWRETLTIQGTGGPRRVWRIPVNGVPIRQTVTPFSLIVATQSGEAVGYRNRPTKPAPLFPAYQVYEGQGATIVTPQYTGNGSYINWPVGWSYRFERADGPLVGFPQLPPGVI